MATRKKAAVEVEETPEVLALKERLIEALERLCTWDGLCQDVFTYAYHPAYKLGLGSRPTYDPYEVDVTMTANGVEIATKRTINAYSQRHAMALLKKEWGVTLTDEEKAEPDSSNDTEEVKAYKELIFALATKQAEEERINRNRLNRTLRWLGVREVPEERQFEFRLPFVDAPGSPYIAWTTNAYSVEQARQRLADTINYDKSRLQYGDRPHYGKLSYTDNWRALANREPVLYEPEATPAAA